MVNINVFHLLKQREGQGRGVLIPERVVITGWACIQADTLS